MTSPTLSPAYRAELRRLGEAALGKAWRSRECVVFRNEATPLRVLSLLDALDAAEALGHHNGGPADLIMQQRDKAIAEVSRLSALLDKAREALDQMLHTHPKCSRRIGGEGSPARMSQRDQEDAIDRARLVRDEIGGRG